jgi:hypothetical protein
MKSNTDASLWNNSLSRRKFIKRSGAAAAGAALGSGGVVLQVLATTSGVTVRRRKNYNKDATGTGEHDSSPIQAFVAASNALTANWGNASWIITSVFETTDPIESFRELAGYPSTVWGDTIYDGPPLKWRCTHTKQSVATEVVEEPA